MNHKLFKMINQFAGQYVILDKIMIFASNKVRYIFAFVLLFMWLRDHSFKKVFCQSVISVIINGCINLIIKQFSFVPRPYMAQSVNVLVSSKHDSSFPSIHTLLTFAISSCIFLYNRTVGSIMLGLSVLTGFSRVWTGVHYPLDVIGSALVGSVTSIMVNRLSRFRF